MQKTSIFITMLAMALSASVFGQATKPAGETEPDTPARGLAIAIPDDGYDGSLASMACRTINRTGQGTVADVSFDVAIEHTWVGDLTIKLVSPASTVATVLSRPGLAEPADDGTGCCGDSSNLVLTSPITFSTTDGLVDAEQMGAGIDTDTNVCADDGECLFTPNSDTASDSGNLTDLFAGESPAGDWQVCVGDSGNLDTGNLGDVTLNLVVLGTPPPPPPPPVLPEATPVPTTSFLGMLLLVLTLGGLGVYLVGKRGS